MTSFRMALNELRRILAGRLPKAAVVALVLVPTMYAGLYLWANFDPYGNLNQVPAALVIDDEPATLPDGTNLEAGRQVGDDLLDRNDFDWDQVSMSEAETGVEDGTYDFALHIPAGFSASLASTAALDPERARLSLLTNDANSYLSTTIAGTVTDRVRDALARQVGTEAATAFLTGFGDIRTQLTSAADGAGQLADGLNEANTGATRLADGATKLDTGAGELSDGLDQLVSGTASLPQQTRKLAQGARQVADANEQIAGVGDEAARAATAIDQARARHRRELVQRMQAAGLTASERRAVLAVFDDLGTSITEGTQKVRATSAKLDQLASGADQVADGNEALAANVPTLVDGITQAHGGATRLQRGAGQLADGATQLQKGTAKLAKGARKLERGLTKGVEQVPDVDDTTRDKLAQVLGDPVKVSSRSDATAGTYGAGLAPFFLSLAAWIGGYVLFLLVRPLSPRALANDQHPARIALGGWMAPALLGLVQMAVMSLVVFGALDIRPANMPGALAFLLLSSAVFVSIVHALSAWFGKAGQFLGLVLMVLQLITAGGTFPWQTLPAALHPVHHALPMTYAVDGLRQLIYGGLHTRVLSDVAVLLAWLLGALLLTSFAARRQRVWAPKVVSPELQM
ncbi:YhgE/Pip domain-containing protein [Nocardioides solisilvae]|uniref:YhgE/Pip domain-containing protein n=1 Tax=Nocardioides solisilvae TaxID=1542435 RepID=UPI000D750CA7|nr:YhgE/Pip domain-containing protein [Nocardioides solisilvae]